MYRNFGIQNFTLWGSRERVSEGKWNPFCQCKACHCKLQKHLLPGVISASTELQLLPSASLGCISLTASICAVSIYQEEESKTGRSNFTTCFYHFLVNFLTNILCWESLVQKNTFCVCVHKCIIEALILCGKIPQT